MVVFKLMKPMTKGGIQLPTGSEVRVPRQKAAWMEARGHLFLRDETAPIVIRTVDASVEEPGEAEDSADND